jgi:tetratricopeptide (TPR) repeat protein
MSDNLRLDNRSTVCVAFVAAVLAAAARPCVAGESVRQQSAGLEIDGVTLTFRDGEVDGRLADGTTWGIRHASLLLAEAGERAVTDPCEYDGALYYGTGCYVLCVDPKRGRVLKRYVFPDRVASLRRRPYGIDVTYGRSRGRYEYEDTFPITPGGDQPRLFLCSDHNSVLVPYRDAMTELRRAQETGDRAPLVDAGARDPTNPFLAVALASVFREAGERGAAEQAVRSALEAKGNTRILLLRAAASLEGLGMTDLADRAFDVGYRAFLDAGGEPELFASTIGLIHFCDSPRSVVLPHVEAGRLDDAGRVMERYWKIAPRATGASLAWRGMADLFAEAGRDDEARKWRERSRYAEGALMAGGPMGGYFNYAAQGINFTWACAAALILTFTVLVLRLFAAWRRRDKREDGGPMGVLRAIRKQVTSREVVGLVLLAGVAYAGLWFDWVGKAATRLTWTLDLSTLCGSWGSRQSLMDWSHRVDGAEGRELYALSMFQAGRVDEAAAILADSCGTAEACNNYGVALVAQGRPSQAKAVFERALAQDPDLAEAAHNLGRPATGVRVERARTYGIDRPLLAMPRSDTVARALVGRYEGRLALLTFPHILTSDDGIAIKVSRIAQVILQIGFLVLVSSLLMMKTETEAETRGASWLMGVAVPGAGRPLAPLGGILLAFYLYASTVLACDAWWGGSGIVSPLEARSIPNVKIAYGVAAALSGTWRGTLIAVSKWTVWVVVIANATALIGLRLAGRDDTLEDKASARWAAVRGVAICCVGGFVATSFAGAGFALLGLSIVAVGAGSVIARVRELRGGASAG